MACLAITVQAAGWVYLRLGGVPGALGESLAAEIAAAGRRGDDLFPVQHRAHLGGDRALHPAAVDAQLERELPVERAELLRRRRRRLLHRLESVLRFGPWFAAADGRAALPDLPHLQGLPRAASRTSGGTCRRCPTCTSPPSKRWRWPSTPRTRPPQSHIRRVQVYAAGIARALGMPEHEIQGVKTAALLHDIGKLAVPEHILSKPGPLTQEEFQKIRIHPQVGAEIISAVPFPYPVAPLILSHHERWDGKGYPQGLKGDEIPLGARILSVVDYFDALTSDRPYHRAMEHDAALSPARAGGRQGARSAGRRHLLRASAGAGRRSDPAGAAAVAPPDARAHLRAGPAGRRLRERERPRQHGVRGHRARAPRDLRALRNRPVDGNESRRRRHDGAHQLEAEQPGAVRRLRALPLRRGARLAALPLRHRRSTPSSSAA